MTFIINTLSLVSTTGYIKSLIFKLKNTNPVSIRITIPARPNPNHTNHRTDSIVPPAPDPRDAHLRETMPSYGVVGKYLLGLLTEEIHANTTPDVFDNYDDADSIVADFCQQFTAYTCQELPFTYSPGTSPHDYWKKLTAKKESAVLAVGILNQNNNLTAND
jgi:hypothetical protein